jgi:protein gp37
MAENSAIEWTDHTWTPVVGCDAVSPACANCYAALMAARLEAMGMTKFQGVAVRAGGKGKWTGRVNFVEADLAKPLETRRAARWFLTSMGDVAHEALTPEQIAEMFGVMAVASGKFQGPRDGFTQHSPGPGAMQYPHRLSGPHTFMVLTKRTARLADLLVDPGFLVLVQRAAYKWAWNRCDAGALTDDMRRGARWPLPNVFIGCTAEDQEQAGLRRPDMERIAVQGWKTFVSYEPALGPVNWKGWEFLQQLISGGESGPKARSSFPDWHRAARDFCAAHGIPYLFKQWGAWYPEHDERGRPLVLHRVGKKKAGRILDGRTHDEMAGAIHE